MDYKNWRKLYMKLGSITEGDLQDDPDWEDEIKLLYDKAQKDEE